MDNQTATVVAGAAASVTFAITQMIKHWHMPKAGVLETLGLADELGLAHNNPLPPIIGFAGPKGGGKSVGTEILTNILVAENELVAVAAFADAVKAAVAQAFCWDVADLEKQTFKESIDPVLGITPRQALKIFGQGMKAANPDIWIRVMENTLSSARHSIAIISDVRFENEADWIRSRGGVIFHIDSVDVARVVGDETEAGIAPKDRDQVVINDGQSIEDYAKSILKALGELTK